MRYIWKEVHEIYHTGLHLGAISHDLNCHLGAYREKETRPNRKDIFFSFKYSFRSRVNVLSVAP